MRILHSKNQLIIALVFKIINKIILLFKVLFFTKNVLNKMKLADYYVNLSIANIGIVYFISSVLCILLLNKYKRYYILIVSITVVILDYIALTLFLNVILRYLIQMYSKNKVYYFYFKS